MGRPMSVEPTNFHRPPRYTPITPMVNQEDYQRNNPYVTPISKQVDTQVNYRPNKVKRSVEWDEENLQQIDGKTYFF